MIALKVIMLVCITPVCFWVIGMARAAGRPCPPPMTDERLTAMREQIRKEGYHV